MSEPSDNYEPSEADLEIVIEESTGKPMKPTNAATGCASMQRRISELEVEKSELLSQMDAANEDGMRDINECLALLNTDLATARERLAHFKYSARHAELRNLSKRF